MGCSESRSSEETKKFDSNEQLVLTKDLQFVIYDCIVNDNYEEIAKGLRRGIDINVRLESFANRTLLHIASELGSHKVMRLLVKEGCNVDAEDDYGITPIFLAALKDKQNCVKILQEAGAGGVQPKKESNSDKTSPVIRSRKALDEADSL